MVLLSATDAFTPRCVVIATYEIFSPVPVDGHGLFGNWFQEQNIKLSAYTQYIAFYNHHSWPFKAHHKDSQHSFMIMVQKKRGIIHRNSCFHICHEQTRVGLWVVEQHDSVVFNLIRSEEERKTDWNLIQQKKLNMKCNFHSWTSSMATANNWKSSLHREIT